MASIVSDLDLDVLHSNYELFQIQIQLVRTLNALLSTWLTNGCINLELFTAFISGYILATNVDHMGKNGLKLTAIQTPGKKQILNDLRIVLNLTTKALLYAKNRMNLK